MYVAKYKQISILNHSDADQDKVSSFISDHEYDSKTCFCLGSAGSQFYTHLCFTEPELNSSE